VAWTFTHGDNPEGSAIAVEASVASTYTAAVGGPNLPTMSRRSISVCLTPPRRPPPSRRWTSSRTASVRRERRPHRFSTEQLALIVLTDTSDRVNAKAALILACALQRLAAQQ